MLWYLKLLHYVLLGYSLLLFHYSAAAFTSYRPSLHLPKVNNFRKSSLYYERHPTDVESGFINGTAAETGTPSISATSPLSLNTDDIDDDKIKNLLRNDLKKQLARAAITHYDAEKGSKNMHAEEVMKQLENLKPWSKPIYDERLNARWSFVFTGVPTIGMRLITVLSRISVGFPIVDFRDVYLEVTDEQSLVKAVVAVKLFGMPVELNVRTSLAPDTSDPEGVMMFEHFEGLILGGQPIPTPKSWSKTRTLEISYLDEDMMIARTSGGEPHMLLRNSPCSSEDKECDIDNDLTEFFMEAREMYGERITRCLVDRDYGDSECKEKSSDPVVNVLNMDPSDLFGPWAKNFIVNRKEEEEEENSSK